jgi:hypothetical protein
MRWFRLYDDVLNDPKVQKLSGETFKLWINVLCIASKHGGVLPSLNDLAFQLRLSTLVCKTEIDILKQAGLIDGDKKLKPHGWEKRQYKSDTSTERVRRFRERSSNVAETVNETGPDTDTEADTETETKQKIKRVISPRGSRLSPDWQPSIEEQDFARQLGIDPFLEADRFRDYWTAQAGQRANKANWTATWRNWCRNAKPARPNSNTMASELLAWAKDKDDEQRISNASSFDPFGLLPSDQGRR